MLGILILVASNFWDRLYKNPNIDPEAIVEAEEEAEEIINRHKKWVQYVLIANSTMKRPCLRCPNSVAMVTVKAGEIYKYGITTQGKSRYTEQDLISFDLRFVRQHQGSYIECKKLEVNKIVAYQFLPESFKPELKLVRPPGNTYRS